jgi:hypothetical protein
MELWTRVLLLELIAAGVDAPGKPTEKIITVQTFSGTFRRMVRLNAMAWWIEASIQALTRTI